MDKFEAIIHNLALKASTTRQHAVAAWLEYLRSEQEDEGEMIRARELKGRADQASEALVDALNLGSPNSSIMDHARDVARGVSTRGVYEEATRLFEAGEGPDRD